MLEQIEKMGTAQFAKKFLGTPFLFNGTDPKKGFDNPGFTVFVIKNTIGIKLPHSANTQLNFGMEVQKEKLKPCDLVFFDTEGDGVSHVGIYMGNGQFIAANSGKMRDVGVSIAPLFSDGYWGPRYVTARRLI